jgi:hypothetical protein
LNTSHACSFPHNYPKVIAFLMQWHFWHCCCMHQYFEK